MPKASGILGGVRVTDCAHAGACTTPASASTSAATVSARFVRHLLHTTVSRPSKALCLRILTSIDRCQFAARSPAAAERLEQAARRLKLRQPNGNEVVFRGKQRLFRLQHRDEIDGASRKLLLGDIECLPGGSNDLQLQALLQREFL